MNPAHSSALASRITVLPPRGFDSLLDLAVDEMAFSITPSRGFNSSFKKVWFFIPLYYPLTGFDSTDRGGSGCGTKRITPREGFDSSPISNGEYYPLTRV